MTNQEYIEDCIERQLGGWVPLKLYISLFNGSETVASVRNRTRQGHWREGIEYAHPKGGGTWVCLPAVKAWVLAQAA